MMYNKIIQNSSFFIFLSKIDQDFATQTHKKPCSHCGGKLNQAHYTRKIRGICLAEAENNRRYSFCCSRDGCRKRVLAPSLRFTGRRVYHSFWFLLVSSFLDHRHKRFIKLQKYLSIDPRTLGRWKIFWKELFPQSQLFKLHKAAFPDLLKWPKDLIYYFSTKFSGQDFVTRLMIFFHQINHFDHYI